MIQPASVLHKASAARPDARSVEIQRVFTVSPQVLWKLFTDPEHYARWWGPKTARCTRCEIDLREGGAWLTTMTFPDGDTATMHGHYIDIDRPNRLEFTWFWSSAKEGSPPSRVLLEFRERGRGSLLRILHSELPEEQVANHERGWMGALECLEEELQTL